MTALHEVDEKEPTKPQLCKAHGRLFDTASNKVGGQKILTKPQL